MTKKDLRTGMVLTCKNGYRYVYLKDYPGYKDGIGINLDSNRGFIDIDSNNDDLTHSSVISGDGFTIMKIEENKSPIDIRKCFTGESTDYKTIWTREPETFKVVCVKHLRNEAHFTIGKIYTWDNGCMGCDDGFRYTTMVEGTDPDKWELSQYYKFIKVVE